MSAPEEKLKDHAETDASLRPQESTSSCAADQSMCGYLVSGTDSNSDAFPVEPYRWLMLAIFIGYSASNAFQWTQLVIISNVIEKFYDVSTLAVSWTSIIFMVTYIPLIFPASWLMHHKGLRFAVLIGAAGNAAGSWIKVFGYRPDNFGIVFVGQTVVAVSQTFILGIPSELAAVWFPTRQVSTACALGVFGNQLGVALGFVLPPRLVSLDHVGGTGLASDDDPMYTVGKDLFLMYICVAIAASIITIVIIIGFRDRPDEPPSAAQQTIRFRRTTPDSDTSYVLCIQRLFSNSGYVLLVIAYGLNAGVFYALSTILNPVVLRIFQGAETEVGNIGLLIVLSGMVGSVAAGIVMDATHAFKSTSATVYLAAFIGMVVFILALVEESMLLVYASSFILGFFMTGYLSVGFEFAAELTFPEPEATSSGLLNASAQIFGILCTLAAEEMIHWNFDVRFVTSMLAGVLLLGSLVSLAIRPDYRRQTRAAL